MNTALREGVGLPRTFPPPPFANAAKDAPLPASFQALLRFSACAYSNLPKRHRSLRTFHQRWVFFTRVGVGWPRPAGRRGPGAQGHVLVTRPGSPAALFREALTPQGLAGSPAAGAAAARGDRSFQKGKRLHHSGNPYFFHCSFITRLSACSTSQKQLTVTVPK